ncbi:hypothetical protein Y1Q_0005622 [Alligator mississippiensis]|uniref:Uncharacterized protein n=1 Tax=Alligator mississippiensis TaxID=8496 RepID=A0A151MF92_ALLMI|nr:hypothetical protein Y1Q_0005622 [Alligator mississippiensis]
MPSKMGQQSDLTDGPNDLQIHVDVIASAVLNLQFEAKLKVLQNMNDASGNFPHTFTTNPDSIQPKQILSCLLSAEETGLTSSSHSRTTFALFPVPVQNAVQVIENPLILCLHPIRLKLLFK